VSDWEQILTDQPKVLWGLVADIVKAAKADEGERRTGRRPAATVSSLDELYAVLFPPAYMTAPFPEAFTGALVTAGQSQRQFALYAGFNQATVSRLASGKLPPSVEMIERISHVLNVRPTYFAEYRALKLGQIVTDVLMAHPGMSAESIRQLIGACP
jgi:hypothetical protein